MIRGSSISWRLPGAGPGSRPLPLWPLGAAAATAVAAVLYVHAGFAAVVIPLLAVVVFLATVIGFLVVPWVAIGVIVPLFTVLPFLKVFVNPSIGPLKDLIILAALAAMSIAALQRRVAGRAARVDRWIGGCVALLLGLYLVNAAGAHGDAWFQGSRLVAEPLVLLLVGLTVNDPRRCLRWGTISLIGIAVPVAIFGVVQQAIGVQGLMSMGYTYGLQVREINGSLRSFGTLDEPFAYAAFMLLALAAILAWRKRSMLPVACFAIVGAGLLVSYVRTALVISVALVAMWLARKHLKPLAFALAVSALVIGGNIVASSNHASQTTNVNQGGSLVTLNGRTDVWGTALGGPSNWILGRGVGVIGTGEERATFGVTRQNPAPGNAVNTSNSVTQVDSAYLAAVADVGFVGLVVLLLLLGRLIVLTRAAVSRSDPAGWFAAGFLLVVLLDGITRASFTAFPNAFLGFLLIGVALAAAGTPRDDVPDEAAASPDDAGASQQGAISPASAA